LPSSASPIPTCRLPPVGTKQVTYLPIRDLPVPRPGAAARRVHTAGSAVEESQIVRLIAMFAMALMEAERSRLKVFAFDEGWRSARRPNSDACLRRVAAADGAE